MYYYMRSNVQHGTMVVRLRWASLPFGPGLHVNVVMGQIFVIQRSEPRSEMHSIQSH